MPEADPTVTAPLPPTEDVPEVAEIDPPVESALEPAAMVTADPTAG